jgi:hypothetical protein
MAGPGRRRRSSARCSASGPAAALVRAAVRETFEECGVLLAGPSPDAVAAGTSGPSWEADRQALADGALSLAQLLIRRGLVLRADLLIPWSRWITPEAEQRRYDARFFVAALPAGQQARGGTGEARPPPSPYGNWPPIPMFRPSWRRAGGSARGGPGLSWPKDPATRETWPRGTAKRQRRCW